MAGRLIPGLPKSVDVSRLSLSGRLRLRRTLTAVATGVALFAAASATLSANVADAANGRNEGLLSILFGGFHQEPLAPEPALAMAPVDAPAPLKRKRHPAAVAAASFSSSRAVCVRLCDGFFFPVSAPAAGASMAGEQANCASLCPDAATALYRQPGGSDRIEDAYSATGQLYSALPTALRYRTTQDNACTCHRSLAEDLGYLRDPTLRRGDAVMTARGVLVYQGAGPVSRGRVDFTALAKAPVPKDQKAILVALERGNAGPQRGATRSWFVDAAPARLASASPSPMLEASPAAARDNSNQIHFVERTASATN